MSGNTFGQFLRVTTWGESHGVGVGVVIDGCPPNLPLTASDIQAELDRRRPGQSELVTPRKESDQVEILSGVFEDKTIGTPIALLIRNENTKSRDYEETKDKYRPSHADYTYDAKYGHRAWPGGGRASARETVGRVAAGAVARVILHHLGKPMITGFVRQIADLKTTIIASEVTKELVESNPVRCPDSAVAEEMAQRILEAKDAGDTLGGVVECVVCGIPAGLGEPVFDKLEADLAKAMLSIPASKGFEIGSGFAGVTMRGSEHNDAFYPDEQGQIRTRTNHSGGVQGGISNGEPIVIRVAFKPVATIMQAQETVDAAGQATTLRARGRHDACVLPRAVPIVEAMMALVLADHWLRWRGQCGCN